MTGRSPGGAKKLARSQPILDPKQALAAPQQLVGRGRRNGRAVASSRFRHGNRVVQPEDPRRPGPAATEASR